MQTQEAAAKIRELIQHGYMVDSNVAPTTLDLDNDPIRDTEVVDWYNECCEDCSPNFGKAYRIDLSDILEGDSIFVTHYAGEETSEHKEYTFYRNGDGTWTQAST